MAVPGSGNALSMAGIAAEKLNDDYDDADFDDVISLKDLTLGGNAGGSHESWDVTNQNSNDFPNTVAPYSMGEFYSYDHDASGFNDNISFDFDGANDYLEGAGNLANAISVSTGSISMWIKIDAHSSNGLIWAINTEEGSTNQIFMLYHNSVGKVRANFKGGNTSNLVDSSSGLEGDNTWHHFVITWKAQAKTSGNEIKMYEDGSLQDTDAIGTTFSGSPAIFGFGRNALQNFGQNFNGHMNDMAIFNDVLTSSEVSSIYNSGAPKDESGHSGLIAYYTLENYSNGDTTVADDSSNSHALTITNSTDIDSTDTP